MKDFLKEEQDNARELIDIDEEGNFSNPILSSSKKSSHDTEYIKIPHHWVIFIPVTLIITFLVYVIMKNFARKKQFLLFLKPKSPEDFNKMGGEIILDIVKKNLRSRISLDIGLPTKNIYLYLVNKYTECEELKRTREKEDLEISFRHVRIFNLEEFCGYDSLNENSFSYWLKDNFINLVDIKEKNVFLLKATGEDLKKNVEEYNQLLMSNPLDLQIINIQKGGLFGFINEGDSFDRRTHVVSLSRKKKKELAEKYFDGNIDKVPEKGITQGIKNIMEAKNILILARGKESALGIKYLMRGEVNKDIPITAFKEYKGNLYVIADEDACSLL